MDEAVSARVPIKGFSELVGCGPRELAHEICNCLGAISGAAEILGDGISAEDPRLEFASILNGEVARLSSLAQWLLGRDRAAAREAVDLHGILATAVQAAEPVARQHQVRVLEQVWANTCVRGDPAGLRTVADNLLLNAIQMSSAGGAVVARVEGLEADRAGAHCVRLVVEDEGPGIPPGCLELMFQPGYSRRPGGTGLGLSISRKVAEANAGELTGRNRPEGGAQFVLELPAYHTQA